MNNNTEFTTAELHLHWRFFSQKKTNILQLKAISENSRTIFPREKNVIIRTLPSQKVVKISIFTITYVYGRITKKQWTESRKLFLRAIYEKHFKTEQYTLKRSNTR